MEQVECREYGVCPHVDGYCDICLRPKVIEIIDWINAQEKKMAKKVKDKE